MSKVIINRNVDISGVVTTQNLIAGKPEVLNQSVINPLTGTFSKAYQTNLHYPERYSEQTGNLYVENNLQTSGECDCQDLVINAKGSLVPRDADMFVRGNLQTQPGSIQKCALGFEGGSYYTNLPFGTKEYKTQVFDEAGPVTRQLIPKALRPLNDPSQNIILCIVDGMGKNQEWVGRITDDMIRTYGNYMSKDVSDNVVNYNATQINGQGSIIPSTSVNDIKLSWEQYSNTRMDMDPVCAEMYWNNQKNYLGVNPDRSAIISKKYVNDEGVYIVADSAATASQYATGRLTQNEIINTITDLDSTAFEKPPIVPPTGLHSKVMTTYTTIFEEAKANGKLTCILSTSNMLHATPASFVSKSNHRDNYTDLIRTCFGPGGVNPNLIIGAVPASGSDKHPTLLDTSSVKIGDPLLNLGYTSSGLNVYSFPEIEQDKAYWDASALPYKYESSTGLYWASPVAYARRYGYTVITEFNDISNNVGLSLPLTTQSKVWFADINNSSPGYINNDAHPLGASLGLSKISASYLRPVDASNATPTGARAILTQADKVKKATELLRNGPKGFIMMYEDSETDWAGHAANFIVSGFETLEGSKAMRDFVYNTDLSANTTIIVTPDHECGGWTFADASGVLDPTDQQLGLYPNKFYDAMSNFKSYSKMHLGTHFLAVDLSFNIKDISQIDASTVSFTNPFTNQKTGLYVDLSNTPIISSNALRIKQGAIDASLSTYSTDISGIDLYKVWVAQNIGTNIGAGIIPKRMLAVVKDASNTIGVYCRTDFDQSGNLLLIRAPITSTTSAPFRTTLDSNRNDAFTLNGTVTITLRLPVSLLGIWATLTSQTDSSMNTLVSSLLAQRYSNRVLYNIALIGFNNDSEDIAKLTMLNKLAVADTTRNSAGVMKTILHSKDLGDIAKSLNNNVEIVRHLQPMYFNVGNNDYYSNNILVAPVWYSHTNSVCQVRIKSAKMYDNTYANLGISVWGGSGTKPSDFLNNKGIASMGIYKLMTGTI